MLLDKRIIPALGSKRIVEIRRSDVSRLHAKMSETPLLANRAVAVVSSVWNWAARREEVSYDGNPARFVERNPEQRRERFLTSEGENRNGIRLIITQGTREERDLAKVKILHDKPVPINPRGRAGEEIEVTFSYDANGMMGCVLHELTTGKKTKLNLQAN
jgi:hypothetical protein